MSRATGATLIGGWLFRYRGFVPVPALLWAFWVTGSLSYLTAVGIGLILMGQVVRCWAAAHIGASSRSRTANARKLVYTGPYELSRNPIYLANWLMYFGVGLATRDVALAACFAIGFGIYFSLIIRYEEHYLEGRLGEIYRSYRNRVPRWGGEAAPVHAASPEGSADERWMVAMRSERSTMWATTLAIVAILLQATDFGGLPIFPG